MKNSFVCFNSITRKFLVVCTLALCSSAAFAQQVMLQGWYWNYPASIGIHRYGQNYLNYVPDFAEAGFDFIWLPPLSRASVNQSMGYDVMDYYDLGEYGQGATRFGTRRDVDNLMTALHQNHIQPVADMVYNQRAGGKWENNPAVQGWITNMNANKISNGDQPYPSDRFRCYIVLGGNSGNGPGTYYFKFRSASLSSNFYGFPYTVQMFTTKTPIATDTLGDSYEFEPNNGGECGDSDNYYYLGNRKFANIDGAGSCGIDEFRLTLDTSLYNASGDTLYITMGNTHATGLGNFSDQYMYDIYSGPLNASIKSQVVYQTMTDYTHEASGRGAMNWSNFKPNGSPTQLSGDWDEMLFFYDVDQTVTSTQKVISDYQDFMFDSIGIQGMRVDAVKNYTYVFAAQMLDSLYFHGHKPQMVVGEFYDYNPSALTGYINNVQSNMAPGVADSIHMKVFDFALRGALKAACDQFGYDVRNVFTAGMVDGASGKGINAVTWVNNHDFRDAGQPVTYNPELVYAYIITNQKLGTPCVYLGDYQGSNFMRGRIKGLMHASKKYITGYDEVDYLTSFSSGYSSYFVKGLASTTLMYQFHNPVTNRAVIAAINFAGDSLDIYQKVNMAHIAVGDTFTDIFGINQPTTTTITANSELHAKLPPRSFSLWVQGGDIQDSTISLGDTIAPHNTTAVNNIETNETISVYPNPFKHNFAVNLGENVNGVVTIEVFDLSGRKVFNERLMSPAAGTFSVNPELSTSGIYICKVTVNNKAQYFKLAKN